ncbi:MAG: hypothetical protein V3T83_11800 [Acidobacteriota bacterium]
MSLQAATLTLSVALVFSCAPKSEPSQARQPPPQQQERQDEEKGIVITGSLEPTVETGGWLLKTEQKSYLLLNIQKYRNEPWFQTGRKVRARGEEDPEVMTFHQQGTPFKVYAMEPVD